MGGTCTPHWPTPRRLRRAPTTCETSAFVLVVFQEQALPLLVVKDRER